MSTKPKRKQSEPEPEINYHRVEAVIHTAVELPKRGSAITLNIYDTEGKRSTLEIGRGSLVWRPRGGTKDRELTWPQFIELMNKHFG
jgi:hypothetical protein